MMEQSPDMEEPMERWVRSVADWAPEMCQLWLVQHAGERYRPEAALREWGVVLTDEQLRAHVALHMSLAVEGIEAKKQRRFNPMRNAG